jgi:hypothetical protein
MLWEDPVLLPGGISLNRLKPHEFNKFSTQRRKGAKAQGKNVFPAGRLRSLFSKQDNSGKVVAQASRLCVPAKGSPVTETHGRDACATLPAMFLWLGLRRFAPLRLCVFALNSSPPAA